MGARLSAVVVAMLVVAMPIVAGASVARAGDDDLPSPFHADLDLSYLRGTIGYVSTGDAPPKTTTEAWRAAAALAYGGVAIEGSVTVPAEGRSSYLAWSVGLRLDTSWIAPVSVMFRFAYVVRTGDIGGRGGRAGVGLVLRFCPAIQAYGEAWAEATSVPHEMNDAGRLFGFGAFAGGGVRLSFR